MMRQIGKLTIEEKEDFCYINISQPTLPEMRDVQSRAEIVQDVIDRMVDKTFSKEYLEDLDKLNKKYPKDYKYVNGVRIYAS
ncbi:hypothetical protein BH23BAC1_BH23BAC1_42120 [soil metagenome]